MVAGKWPHLLLRPWAFPSDVCRDPGCANECRGPWCEQVRPLVPDGSWWALQVQGGQPGPGGSLVQLVWGCRQEPGALRIRGQVEAALPEGWGQAGVPAEDRRGQ